MAMRTATPAAAPVPAERAIERRRRPTDTPATPWAQPSVTWFSPSCVSQPRAVTRHLQPHPGPVLVTSQQAGDVTGPRAIQLRRITVLAVGVVDPDAIHRLDCRYLAGP